MSEQNIEYYAHVQLIVYDCVVHVCSRSRAGKLCASRVLINRGLDFQSSPDEKILNRHKPKGI